NSAAALSLALDKEECKAILQAAGIAAPRYQVLDPSNVSRFHLNYPCIVKPCAEDASHGLSPESVVYDKTSLEKQVGKISKLYGGKALVEEFLEGREFNITVLGNGEVFPISEIVYSLPAGMPRILTFGAKWRPDDVYYDNTRAHCPADISDVDREYIVSTARLAFKALGCRGYARVDLRLDGEGELNVLEVNPNPDVSPATGAALQAQAAGISYNQFIQKIVDIALEDHRKCRQ
ncbi:MAG: ATP-grasp domain-containing protein, partial [Chloroflexi bacterium]|nr:ATP-grasp domain-containing protein [Chloroflexota bacterium]